MILMTLIGSQVISKKGDLHAFISRKVLHIAGVGGLAVSPWVVHHDYLLLGMVAAITLLLFYAIKRQWLGVDLYNRPSWGIALFPISFILLWLFWGRSQVAFVVYPMLVLTFADAGAALAGKILGGSAYNLTGDPKTYIGSLVFTFICGIILYIPELFPNISPNPWHGLSLSATQFIIICVATCIFAGFAEGVFSGGWDNVSVPLAVSWFMAVLPKLSADSLYLLLPVMVILFALGLVAFQKKWLDKGGAVTAGMLGLVIWISGGWQALLLIGFFFVSGSFLSKIEASGKKITGTKIGRPRDYWQVLCNGGVACACMIWQGISPSELPIFLYGVSVAISTADTWSSSIGNWAQGTVVDIFTFRKIPTGISGGISWQGTMAGLAGGLFIGLCFQGLGLGSAYWVVVFGFTGMLVDSALGSLWQARFAKNGLMVEEIAADDKDYVLQKGVKWLTNDRVNIISNLFITILAGFLAIFLGIRG